MTERDDPFDDPYALPVRTGDRFPSLRKTLRVRDTIQRLSEVHHQSLEVAANPPARYRSAVRNRGAKLKIV